MCIVRYKSARTFSARGGSNARGPGRVPGPVRPLQRRVIRESPTVHLDYVHPPGALPRLLRLPILVSQGRSQGGRDRDESRLLPRSLDRGSPVDADPRDSASGAPPHKVTLAGPANTTGNGRRSCAKTAYTCPGCGIKAWGSRRCALDALTATGTPWCRTWAERGRSGSSSRGAGGAGRPAKGVATACGVQVEGRTWKGSCFR